MATRMGQRSSYITRSYSHRSQEQPIVLLLEMRTGLQHVEFCGRTPFDFFFLDFREPFVRGGGGRSTGERVDIQRAALCFHP